VDKPAAPWSPLRTGKEKRRMMQVLNAFYRNAVVTLIAVAVLAALTVYIGMTTVGAFLVMLFGMLIILWDAHTDPHIPEAPSL
jgi:predicted PurR-regulated permease PerM